jgi:hypothetical protein
MTTESELLETALLIEEMGGTKEPWGEYDVIVESCKCDNNWACEIQAHDGFTIYLDYGRTLSEAVRACYYGFKEQDNT